jgi:hypothetical protein
LSLSDRMPVVDMMFDLVADNVGPGPDRDRLLQRHFRVEMGDSAFEGYRTERDESLRAAAFGQFRRVVDAYYNADIERTLPPADRVLMRLISEDRAEEFAAYLDEVAQADPPSPIIEGERLFLGLPWFRDPDRRLPDDLFDIGAQLKAECRIEPLLVETGSVRFRAECRLGALTDRVTDVGLVARSRAGGDDVVIPLAHRVVLEEVRPFVLVEDAISADRLLGALPDDTYALYLRVAAGTTWRERRVSECTVPPPGSRIVRRVGRGVFAKSGTLRTTTHDNLSLRVEDGPRSALRRLRRVLGP